MTRMTTFGRRRVTMPTLDELKFGEVQTAPTHASDLYPPGFMSKGPFGGLMIVDVAAQRAWDLRRPDVKFAIGGNETYEAWYRRHKDASA